MLSVLSSWWDWLTAPPAVWVAVGIGIWLTVCVLLGWLGGWLALASSYRSSQPGPRGHLTSIALRWGFRYNNCVWLAADSAGLRLSILVLFRLGHPALVIPWSDISIVGQSVDWFGRVQLRFAQAPGVPLRLHENIARVLAGESRGRFRLPVLARQPRT
jgi:hypothetical protein